MPYIYSTSCREQAKWIETVFQAKVQGEIYEDPESKLVMHMRMKFPTGHDLYLGDKGGYHKMAKVTTKVVAATPEVSKDISKAVAASGSMS